MKLETHVRILLSAGLMTVAGAAAQAQVLSNSSPTIRASLCVGNDCATNEAFGFDTLRLKENNLRLHFDDTSTAASFPRNDWRLIANDSANGGASYFAIEDASAARIPFRVEANAPTHSLYVESSGEVGIGTNNPVAELHAVKGDTPTLRLEQNGSSGFTPQTWDVAGNETSFFVRDATNGSTLPFRIRPDAPSDALVIAAGGDVGVGILSPDAAVHVRRSASAAAGLLKLTNNDTVFLTLEDTTGETWNIQSNNGEFRFTNATGPGVELAMTTTGDLTITGELTTTGSCSVGCDAVFSHDYDILPIAERAELMWANGYLPNVGPTPEDGPFNITDKVGRMLNELEHAHIYIAQLHAENAAQSAAIAAQNARLEALEAASAD